jgi:hypothetical protein
MDGPVDVQLRGRLGREPAGTGLVVLARTRLWGVEVSDWRLPLDWSVAAGAGRGRLAVRDSAGQVALGRVQGHADLSWGETVRLDARLRLFGVELRTLLRPLANSTPVGGGRLTGRLDLAASDLRSPDDLTGMLEARFQEAQALEFPALRQVVPWVAPGQAAMTFRSGDVRARLAHGTVKVERLALTAPALELFAEGTVTLAGRLNLEVTARTGQVGANPQVLRLLGVRIPAVGPVPLALLTEATNYLSNRVVHLHVSGTVRSPVVRVEPLGLLSDEAVRFFLGKAGVPAVGL